MLPKDQIADLCKEVVSDEAAAVSRQGAGQPERNGDALVKGAGPDRCSQQVELLIKHVEQAVREILCCKGADDRKIRLHQVEEVARFLGGNRRDLSPTPGFNSDEPGAIDVAERLPDPRATHAKACRKLDLANERAGLMEAGDDFPDDDLGDASVQREVRPRCLYIGCCRKAVGEVWF